MMKRMLAGLLPLLVPSLAPAQPPTLFDHGEAISLERAIPANERGILCLATGDGGRVFGGTTGRAAHLFVHDPNRDEVRSLARLGGGIGFAYGLLRLPDGSLLGGTQADPTGTAVRTDPAAVGHLYRFVVPDGGPAKVEDLGVAVPGQGIHTLAYLEKTAEVVGNTWPDGHFFVYDTKVKTFRDHGAIAGYRPFETPRHAEEVSRGTGRKVTYARQVSRAIVVDPATGAYTAGADGFLYRYDPDAKKLEKLATRLPAAAGREPWASLDAAVLYGRTSREEGDYAAVVGGTADGHLFELRIFAKDRLMLRPRGKPLREGTIQGLVATEPRRREGGGAGAGGGRGGGEGPGQGGHTVHGVGGSPDGMPRAFVFSHGASSSQVTPGGIPKGDGQPSMVGFGALIADGRGNVYAGERDRLGRLVRYPVPGGMATKNTKSTKSPESPSSASSQGNEEKEASAKLPCRIVFAPEGTTTDGSGYTAIEVGKDGLVYVGAARYGDYAWLLRFDPARQPMFMDKVVNFKQLTGERRTGINTQGKIHAKILVGSDGRVWFASKQAHEVFDTRPEYGEDADGYPGGHLCYFDPKTGFSRSLGILKKQEGLQGGALDETRGKLYYRSEPKNHFLVYDLKTGDVQDRGHVGAACRYMALDRNGAVYTVGRGNTLCRYDPETGYVEDLTIRVEGDGGYSPPYVLALGPNGKLYGAGTSHPYLMEFDIDRYQPGPFPAVTMRNVAPAAPPGMPVQDIHAGVFGKDGRLYYPLNTTGPSEKAGKPQAHLRVMRFDPTSKKVETVGIPQPVDFDEAKVKHVYARDAKYELKYIQGAAVGADGTLYLMAIYPQLNVACFQKLTAPK